MIRPSFVLLFFFTTMMGFSQENLVDDLKIEGTKRTKVSFLKKLIQVHSGAVLDSVALRQDMERLKRLPSISHAYFQVFSAEDGKHNIFYHIEENFTLIPFANLFSSSNDDFAFRIGLQEFNLLGRNITLGGFYQYDVFNSYGLSLRAPYLFSNKLGLALNYHDFTTQEPCFLKLVIIEFCSPLICDMI